MTLPTVLVVDVQVACESPDIPPDSQIECWVSRAVNAAGSSFPDGADVSVRLVDAEEMRSLNRDYRQKDRETNVLSFPGGEIAGLPDDAARALGDIVVCAPVVSNEAAEQGKSASDHWAHMLVHGTLHLLGFDHQSDTDAAEMEGLETQILVSSGLADPYLKS